MGLELISGAAGGVGIERRDDFTAKAPAAQRGVLCYNLSKRMNAGRR